MEDRLYKLISNIPEGMDGIMITSEINRRYYTGFHSSAGTVLALRDKCYFIIDSRYHEMAQSVVKNCEIILQEQLYSQISALLKKHGVKTLGIEGNTVSIGTYQTYLEKLEGIEIPMNGAVSDLMDKQRRVKTPEEIEYMAAAQKLADKTFDYILGVIKSGMTEQEIALEMEMYSRKNGSEEASFSFIVASGPNSSKPHAVPGNRKLCSGDFLTMDFGCVTGGYRSDMTRTIAISGVSEKQREVYALVLKAQTEALRAIRPGIPCNDVDRVARDIIDGTEFSGMFGHGLGHSLGLEIHEPPRFNRECEVPLEPGFVMSVEPGVYIPEEFGVRIEDVIVVTKDGFRNLMASPKDLIIL